MNRLIFTVITLVIFTQPITFAQQVSQQSLQVMTFNIRYNNPDDGEHVWPNRKEHVAGIIRFHKVDLLGMQEVTRGQLDDLVVLLPEYSWVGVGRDDGKNGGEFSPVFYRTDRFELEGSGTFWLSEAPEIVGSKSWDTSLTRIATWARLMDRESGHEVFFLNTHFDHRGEQARTESAALIVRRLQQMTDGESVIVTGDFNVPSTTQAYATMTDYLRDSRLVSLTPPHGPVGTNSGFTVSFTPLVSRIDYIFVDDSIVVERHGVISDQWNGVYASDHLPVLSEIRFSN